MKHEALLVGAYCRSVDPSGRGELEGVYPIRELNDFEKGEFPDESPIGAVVTIADENLYKRASVSTATEAIGELEDAEDLKDGSFFIVSEEVPMQYEYIPVDGLADDDKEVLESDACGHEINATCVGYEVAVSAEQLLCVNSNDVGGER